MVAIDGSDDSENGRFNHHLAVRQRLSKCNKLCRKAVMSRAME